MRTRFAISAGDPGEPGARHGAARTNFSVYSREATGMTLLLYRDATEAEPFQAIPLDPVAHRHAFTWHVAVEKLPAGVHYNWQVTLKSAAGIETRHEVLDPFALLLPLAVLSAAWPVAARSGSDKQTRTARWRIGGLRVRRRPEFIPGWLTPA